MKPAIALTAFMFAAVSAFGSPTEHYIVGVTAVDPVMVAIRAVEAPLLGARHFRSFAHLGAFAADLTADEAAALRRDPEVRFVEESMRVHAFANRPAWIAHAAVPLRNPNVQTTPWGVTAVDAPASWPASRGDAINVAIIDTGIDYNHEDIAGQYAGGYCTMNGTTDPMDDNGHGTHVAGTIAAENNGYGVVGVAPHAHLWAVKVLGWDGSGTTADIAAAFDWIIRKKQSIGGNWIINMSFGICSDPTDFSCASKPPQTLVDACQRAADAGILMFAAAGNDSSPDNPAPVAYPAAFPTVVAIGALDSHGAIASFSDQGPELAAVAPGVDVLSTYLTGQGSNSYVTDGPAVYDTIQVSGSAVALVRGKAVYCGLGASAGDFPLDVKDNIALMERNSRVAFDQQTKNAMAAGAAAVVIYNCSKASSPQTCSSESDVSTWSLVTNLADGTENPFDVTTSWPLVLGVSNTAGMAMRAVPNASVAAANVPDDYEVLSGTSMSSPHAAGVAALVWSVAPRATAADIRRALLSTARDLGKPGQDPVFGSGMLDAAAAIKLVAPQLATLIGTTVTPPSTGGRPFPKRGH